MQLTTVQQVADGVWPKGGVQMGTSMGVFSCMPCIISLSSCRIEGQVLAQCVPLVAPQTSKGRTDPSLISLAIDSTQSVKTGQPGDVPRHVKVAILINLQGQRPPVP